MRFIVDNSIILQPKQTKADYVYENLRDMIENSELPPDTILSIREISARMDVSRTPVKEAISRLVFEGYAEMLPNHCAVVSRINSSLVLEILELREALEHYTAYYAAMRRTAADIKNLEYICEQHAAVPEDDLTELSRWDAAFHLAVADATYNQSLSNALQQVFAKLTRISMPVTTGRAQASVRQHKEILNAIVAGDRDEAKRLMTNHNLDIQNSTREYQVKNVHLFK